ncbi:MAG: hypothetical protein NT013_15485 [Planctomycetia bacterium]|nr:hypothetical protein [Planctomycetia bacterium]
MHDLPRQKLTELLAKYGHGVCDDPKRLEALLKDLLRNEHKRETFVLTNALREGVAKELRTSTTTLPTEVLAAKLVRQLRSNLGLEDSVARWGVESWAIALGVPIRLPTDNPTTLSLPPSIFRSSLNGSLESVIRELAAATSKAWARHHGQLRERVDRAWTVVRGLLVLLLTCCGNGVKAAKNSCVRFPTCHLRAPVNPRYWITFLALSGTLTAILVISPSRWRWLNTTTNSPASVEVALLTNASSSEDVTIQPTGDSGAPIPSASKPFENSTPDPVPFSNLNDVGRAIPSPTETKTNPTPGRFDDNLETTSPRNQTKQDQEPLEKPSAKVAQVTKTDLPKPIKSASKDELGKFVPRTERLKPLQIDKLPDQPPSVSPSKEGMERAKEYRKRGDEEFGINNYKEAIRQYSFAVLLDGSETSFGDRAVANFYARNYRDAIEDCTKVIGLSPRNAAAFYMRGLCYRKLEQPSQAEPDIARAVELDKTIVERRQQWVKR